MWFGLEKGQIESKVHQTIPKIREGRAVAYRVTLSLKLEKTAWSVACVTIPKIHSCVMFYIINMLQFIVDQLLRWKCLRNCDWIM